MGEILRRVPGASEALKKTIVSCCLVTEMTQASPQEGTLLSAAGNTTLTQLTGKRKFISHNKKSGEGTSKICLFSGSTMSPRTQVARITIWGITGLVPGLFSSRLKDDKHSSTCPTQT